VHLSLGKPKYVATSTQAPHGLLESETVVFSTGDFSNGDSPIGGNGGKVEYAIVTHRI